MKKNLIITFHSVSNVKWFENVILFLKSKYDMVNLKLIENLNNYNKKKGFCHLTFDDGDKTFYDIVFPVLRKYEVPATIFVSPKIIIEGNNFWFQEVRNYDKNKMKDILAKHLSLYSSKLDKLDFINILKCLRINEIKEVITKYQEETKTARKPCLNMNLSEITEVDRSGLITIGAHTLNHPILKNENDEICLKEITGSILKLQELLGHEVRYFAYPNGIPNEDFGNREIEILSKNNITIALSSESKFLSNKDNKLAFPRIGLSYGSNYFVYLKLKLGSNWDKIKSLSPHTEIKDRRKVALLITKINSINQNHRL